MTSTTLPGIAEAIERAYTEPMNNFPPITVQLSDGLGMWWWDFTRAFWDRWDCESDECPGTPAWDVALGEEGDAARRRLEADVVAFVRECMATFAETFQREYPEAVLRPPETVDA